MRRRAVLASLPGLAFARGVRAAPLRAFGRGDWKALREAQAGRPALVHFWGLTCAPCIVELPAWAQLRRQCPDLALILVAADPVPRAAEEVARTLHEAGLGAAESWIFQPGQARRLYFEVDPDWQGELPRTVRLDRDGTALHHLGTSDMAALRAWYQRSSS